MITSPPELDGVPPSNIWNYDETNLTDDPCNKKIIVKRGAKNPETVINCTKSATSLCIAEMPRGT